MLTKSLSSEKFVSMKHIISILLLIMIMGNLQVWTFPLFELFDNLLGIKKSDEKENEKYNASILTVSF
jgi:hypothetical protein